jgi:hypothetical protein
MKRFFVLLLAVLFSLPAFCDKLWVRDGYVKIYNTTAKTTTVVYLSSVSRIYIKGNDINISTNNPSADVKISYGSLTEYNGGTVPTMATIVEDVMTMGMTEQTEIVGDSILSTSTEYAFPINSTHVWNTAFSWTSNTDTLMVIPFISTEGIRTVYPGLDTVYSVSSPGTMSFDDEIFSGDTLIFKISATDTVVMESIVNKISK